MGKQELILESKILSFHMNHFKQLYSYLLIFTFVCGSLPYSAHAQFLNWDYEDVLTDVQQSGANPDMVADAQGNLHVSFWRKEENQLAYAFRDRNTGMWSFEILDSATYQQGFKSSILVDEQQKVHIAYLKKIQNQTQVRYITNTSGNWQVEIPFSNQQVGIYGTDYIWPRLAKHSLNLKISQDGQPVIVFFDASTYNFANCAAPINYTYINYALDMKGLKRNANGTWQTFSFPNIPDKYGTPCLPGGDRFGEFNQWFSLSDGRMLAITNSFHNHQLLLFESAPNDLNSWTTHVIDSVGRLFFIRDADFRLSFEYISAELVNDTSLYLIYGVSNEYGNGPIDNVKKHLIYAHLNLDSLQSATYTPYYQSLLPGRTYRSFSTITPVKGDSLFIGFYNLEANASVLGTSTDNGLTWTMDTIHKFNINTFLRSAFTQDSIRVLAYEAEKDRLVLSSKPFGGGNWRHEFATIYEERGRALGSTIRRVGGQDEIHIVFNELGKEQLFYGVKTGGSWAFETIGQANNRVRAIDLILDDQANPCIAFSQNNDNTLRFGHKNGNSWSMNLVENNSNPQDINLILRNNIHICYFDLNSGNLKYANASSPSGPWNVEVIDSSSSIVGKYASFEIDAGGTLHVSYLDIINSKVKYAHKASGGNWMIEDVTEALNYSPNIAALEINSEGLPIIAFSDGTSNQIFISEKGADDLWTLSQVNAESVNLAGNPLRLIIDDQDNPWILYNYIELQDEMRLVRRDQQRNWNQVSIVNNAAEIANQFDFHLVEQDFYIIGKKNQADNNGIGLLYAENGVKTSIPDPATQVELTLAPNPTKGALNISFYNPEAQKVKMSLYNLEGKLVHLIQQETQMAPGHQELKTDISNLTPGVYICSWEAESFRLLKKVVLLPR